MSKMIRDAVELPAVDQRLVDEYERLATPVDDLPYTSEFQRMVDRLQSSGDTRTPAEILRRLLRLRKAAKLPRVGRVATTSLKPPTEDVELLEGLLRQELSSPGARDSLLYTEQFDRMLAQYNLTATQTLSPHDFWRLIARLSK